MPAMAVRVQEKVQPGMSEEEVTAAIADYRTKKAASQPNVSAVEKGAG